MNYLDEYSTPKITNYISSYKIFFIGGSLHINAEFIFSDIFIPVYKIKTSMSWVNNILFILKQNESYLLIRQSLLRDSKTNGVFYCYYTDEVLYVLNRLFL